MTLSIQLDPEKYHSRLKEYFKNATEWGSIFVPNDSPKKIIKNAINLKNRFLNYDEIVLQMLNEDSNLVLFGRRGTGKTTYVTYSFFERLEAFDENSGLFPVYVNLNLMNPSIASIDILTSYFFVVLIQSVLKSVQIYWQYTSNKGIFEKLAKNFKKSIFGGLEKYVDKDLIEENENIFKLTTETQSNEDDEEDQKDLENYLKSRDDFNKKLNLIFKQKQILVNYDTFYLISDRILSTLNASGFILYIDEVSEFFVSREKEGQHLAMIPVFLDFVQNIVTLNEKKYFLKLVLYQREDLDYIYCRAKREPDIKGWSYCTLDIYQNTEEMVKRKAEEKKKIKKIYQDLIKEKIFYFLVKGCDDEENTLMNQLEKIEGNVNDYKKFETNVLKNIFQDYEKNSLNIFYLLNFSTGGAIRELAFILKDALTREQGIPLIQLDNIRLAISTRYNSRRDESKEVKLFETVILEKFKNKENQLFFLEKIQDDFLPNQQEIARALSKLEQNFLINFVSDKIEGIYKVYCYHPGFANSQDNFYACLQLKVDQKASLTIFSKRDLWRNYFDEIKEEEKQNDNLIFKQHFDAIVEYLDKNQEFALLQKLKDMEEFINFEDSNFFVIEIILTMVN